MNNFYIKYKSPITIILILILFSGVYSLFNLKTSLFPDITFPKIKIIVDSGEQPVNKMMVTVTVPLENAIKRVEELNLLRSKTSRGSCEISAFLNWGSDIDLGKQRIEARINSIKEQLPPGISISVEKMNPSILPIMGFSLEGEGKSLIELRKIAEYEIKPIFARVQGVADVAVIGGKQKEYLVLLDIHKMSNLKITPSYVFNILSQTNFISSNGLTSDYNRLYLTLTDASILTKRKLENTVVLNNKNVKILLKDISKIEITEKREFLKIYANGKDVPLIAILKQPKANLIDVSEAVNSQLSEINKILPPGVLLKAYYNQADFVSNVMSSLKDVLWVGLLLSLIVTFLFLKSIKASFVILITIPITLSLTLLCLYVFNYTFDIMTIGAIAAAIGLIIDDAIVVVEQIHRTHEENPDGNSYQLVKISIKYLFPAMVGSSLSTIVIFFPFVLMSGVAGSYFKVMTDTMIITLVSSFLVVWLGLPVIYLLLSKGKHSIVSAKPLIKRNWVYYFINHPIYSIIFICLIIISAFYILPRLQSGFLPEMDEGSIVLDYVSPPGSSLEATNEMLTEVDKILKTIPEVENFSRRTGTQMGFFITEPNDGDYLIQLKSSRDKTTEEVSDEIRNKIENTLPFLQIDFGQVIGDMLGDLMESVQPIEVKLFGDDPKKLKLLADSVAAIVESSEGTADVFNGIVVAGPEIIFEPKAANLAQYNMSPSDLQFQLQTKIEGIVVGEILEKNQMVDVRITENQNTPSTNKLENSYIFLNDGMLKPIKEFTDIVVNEGVAEIERENLKSMVAVTARLNQRDLGSTLNEIKQNINANLILPNGNQLVYGGAYAEQQNSFKELLLILISAVMLVFTVILFLFRNIRVSLAIILISVLGLAGSLIALYITGTLLNVGSYTGIIMIIGIIGENSIFTYLQFAEERKKSNKVDSLVYSISTRLRPKLMTSLGAITALAPLALGIGTGAQMHQPLAIAIIGGLLFALPLLLVVLPTILKIIEKE